MFLASARCCSAIRTNSPADSVSAWPLGAPSSAIRGCSCFDEPLSSLDAQLRDEMRGEIKRPHQHIATTMIYVTHEQIEAMTLADRFVLRRDGAIEQQGASLELFERPATLFIASFIGSPKMSLLRGQLQRSGGSAAARIGDDGPVLASPRDRKPSGGDGSKVILGLRPEHVERAAGRPVEGTARIGATTELIQPTGSRSYATFDLVGQQVMAERRAHDVSRSGELITVDIDLRRAVLFSAETGRAL
jgi:multiple sugar transport system ATP-binding protein